jgi:hypothetical protein
MAKLVWEKSGDIIEIQPINQEVYSYFVENLYNTYQNFYTLPVIDVENFASELKLCLKSVNNVLQNKFHIQLWSANDLEFLDQLQLNHLHKNWVDLHLQYPNLPILLEKILPGSQYKLNRINKCIHKLEESFDSLRCLTPDPTVNFSNPFGENILNFDTSGIRVEYNNLGRSTYNKWLNFDNNMDAKDTNNFNEIYTSITVSLARSCTGSAPKEYIEWTKLHNTKPHGKTLNLAKFDKLDENLLLYRNLFYKNSRVTDNYFTLKE